MKCFECLNSASDAEARTKLEHCCASTKWVDLMMATRPFNDDPSLQRAAQACAEMLNHGDWMEAFAGHPRIGDVNSLREKYASTKHWASGEQAGVNIASEATLLELSRCNDLYYDRFRYIFIVCATGKSADEMLAILKSRLSNDPELELRIAAEEQKKITWLRLQKLANAS